MREKWVKAIRRKNFHPTEHSKVCSNHFTAADFDRERLGKRWLKKGAIPSIFNFNNNEIRKRRKKLICSPEQSLTGMYLINKINSIVGTSMV